MSESTDADGKSDPEHLEDVPDGCGCAEVWEHLSERREERTERES